MDPAKPGGTGGIESAKRGTKKRKRRTVHGSGSCSGPDGDDNAAGSGSTGSNDPNHNTISCTASLRVDFREFATKYDDFAKAWDDLRNRRRQVMAVAAAQTSFSTHVDSAFNLALTRATLRSNFGFLLPSLPDGYLCPPVPNRLNYVLWLNLLLRQSSDPRYFEVPHDGSALPSGLPSASASELASLSAVCETRFRHRGIDIGCGASCIYPLLLTTDRFCPEIESKGNKWKIFATDVDEESVKSARQNVNANNLDDRIEVSLVPRTCRQMSQDTATSIVGGNPEGAAVSDQSSYGPVRVAVEAFWNRYCPSTSADDGPALFDFCMTNPPFYGTDKEATADRKGDGRSRTDMSTSEGVYPGGEVGFVRDMIADSVHLSGSITWFSAMLARKTSLVQLEKDLLGTLGRGAVRTATFLQGKTTRWGIAWTHRRVVARSPATRVMGGLQGFNVSLTSSGASSAVGDVVSRICSYCQYVASTKGLRLDCVVQSSGAGPSIMANRQVCTIVEIGSAQKCGAFFIDVYVQHVKAGEKGKEDGADEVVEVRLHSFIHSVSGRVVLDKVRDGMEGEVQRSNRRWRRMAVKERNVRKC